MKMKLNLISQNSILHKKYLFFLLFQLLVNGSLLSLFYITPTSEIYLPASVIYKGGEGSPMLQAYAEYPPFDPIKKISESEDVMAINPFTNITKSGEYFDGNNLFILQQNNVSRISKNRNQTLFITDMSGEIIKRKSSFNSQLKIINSTTLLLGSTGGATLWNIYEDNTESLGFDGHHEFEYNPINETFFTLHQYNVEIDDQEYLFDKIMEFNATGDQIWSLDTRSFISYTQWCPFNDYELGVPDITHSNSLFFDAEENAIYFHARNVNTFYKIDHSTGEVIWGLGEYGNFTLFDRKGTQKENLFYHAHAVEKIDEYTFILFDNDFHNQTNSNNKKSRILEITINETYMYANESWSWIAPSDYYSFYWGDADRLPNGNRLATFGTFNHPNTNLGARVVEVNNVGKIVWEMNFPPLEDSYFGVYRCERLRFNPILDSPLDFKTFPHIDSNVSWQAWFNHRSNIQNKGFYTLYLDGLPLDTGSFKYDKFWRPVTLEFNLGKLDIGDYNCTLTIEDDAGHITTDSINVSSNVVHRNLNENYLVIEKGNKNSVIQWYSFQNHSMLCNITINDSILASFAWNNSISLDLNSQNTGNYNISIQLFNDTITYFRDSIITEIYPSLPPVIISSPIDQSAYLNDAISLEWEIFDVSPSSYDIFINNTLILSEAFEKQDFNLIWNVPILNEGNYNISLRVHDLNGNQISNSLWLTIIPKVFPVITSVPQKTVFQWGCENITLVWEVQSTNDWKLWINESLMYQGEVENSTIDIQVERLYPGRYNLTLQLTNNNGFSISDTFWLQLELKLGDAYANLVVTTASLWYLSGNNALGPPDGGFAIIFPDYSNGYLTLDMGEGEEIIDGNGSDFTIIAEGGEYSVWIGNNLESSFIKIGNGIGNQSFDLAAVNNTNIRYLRIEYQSDVDVALDAIVAENYNKLLEDYDKPYFSDVNDFWVWEGQNAISLIWFASDLTPWNYSIMIDGIIVESGSWDGSNIHFMFDSTSSGTYKIILILYDVFGNFNSDSVNIEVRSLEMSSESSSLTTSKKTSFPIIILVMVFGLLIITKKKKI